jgi:hypothetical protein
MFALLLVASATIGASNGTLRKVGQKQRSLSEVSLMTTKQIMNNLSARVSERSLTSTFLDFSAFSVGEIVSNLADGVTVVAMKQTSKGLILGKAKIFDSTNPSVNDRDLGTPNVKFGGPGVGKAGMPTNLFPNKISKGNIIIISEEENSSDPDENSFRGELRFYFDPPRFLATVGLLDNDGKSIQMMQKIHCTLPP